MATDWKLVPKSVRESRDPIFALALWSIAGLAVVGGALSIPFGWSLADMLPIFGGAVLLLGSYSAARTLRENELDRAVQMLESKSAAVRAAGVHRLAEVGRDAPGVRDYVQATLAAYVTEHRASDPAWAQATSVLAQYSEAAAKVLARAP